MKYNFELFLIAILLTELRISLNVMKIISSNWLLFIPWLKGKISKIGAESLPPDNLNRISRFPVIINLNKNYLLKDNQKYSLITGQSISANIIIRKKRLITVLSDLFGKSIDSLKKIRTRI